MSLVKSGNGGTPLFDVEEPRPHRRGGAVMAPRRRDRYLPGSYY
jgi:hypothetical protein